ncbi:MAG: hypothetical protein NTY60_03780 [Proteobacteria bacterium]|nr:hypothetical protein [Pseudomonadota bacterium]
MKTILFVNSSGARYFRRDQGVWQLIEKPDIRDRLWVIANLPEETLETFALPLLFGRDRSHFLERHLATAFPHSEYRAAPVLSGRRLKSGTAALSGLTTAEAVTRELAKLNMPIAGVWGISMLLTLMARRLSITNVVLVIPSVHFLRILVLKDGIPVITRCIHRYSEDNDSDANEILRTRQHLENKHIFEYSSIPPVLYLGESESVGAHLSRAGIALLPLPDALAPRGDAAYLHPLFELVVSSPRGQLAPLQLRARHLAQSLRQAAYAGIACSLLAAMLFGQADLRELITLHGRAQTLEADLLQATGERERLAARISATGTDPALVRQATKFAALELEAATTTDTLLQLTADTIADLPQVRIKNLTFRFPKHGESYCQGHTVIELPLINRKIDLPLNSGSTPADSGDTPQRFTELQFSILLTDELAPAAQIEIKKHISTVLKAKDGVQLMQDPAAFSLINTLKGGFGMDTTQTDNLWCMSIPWKSGAAKEKS